MKNIVVANYQEELSKRSTKQYRKERLLTDLRAQIDNSLRFACEIEDVVVITNFPFSYLGVSAHVMDLNQDCLTASKMFALREILRREMTSEPMWVHDLDAWQNAPFNAPPEFKDIGIAEYSRPKYNGGSLWCRPSAADIIEEVCRQLVQEQEKREEPVINRLFRGQFSDRVTRLNSTWNVGCSGFVKRYLRAEKPVKVVHFHPANRIAWDTHARDRNRLGCCCISDDLRNLLLKHYGDRIT